MKRFFLVMPPLACTVMLLTACPDTKLPDPSPMVPKPKAEALAPASLPGAPGGSDPPPARAPAPSRS